MTKKQINKMSEAGSVETLHEICTGLKDFAENCPESVKPLLVELVEKVLNELDCEDFFGTEGWEHYFGMAD